MSDSASGEILTAFSIICLIAWWNDWPPIASNEVTTYKVSCPAECKPEERVLYRQIYRADVNNHTVTTWTKEGSDIWIYRDCAIRDKNNWRCNTRELNSNWHPTLTDGAFSGYTNISIEEQVPWYRWWWLKFLQIGDKK